MPFFNKYQSQCAGEKNFKHVTLKKKINFILLNSKSISTVSCNFQYYFSPHNHLLVFFLLGKNLSRKFKKKFNTYTYENQINMETNGQTHTHHIVATCFRDYPNWHPMGIIIRSIVIWHSPKTCSLVQQTGTMFLVASKKKQAPEIEREPRYFNSTNFKLFLAQNVINISKQKTWLSWVLGQIR